MGADFVALGAEEPPVGDGESLDDGFLDGALGLELTVEVGEEVVKVGEALGEWAIGKDDVFGEEAVF